MVFYFWMSMLPSAVNQCRVCHKTSVARRSSSWVDILWRHTVNELLLIQSSVLYAQSVSSTVYNKKIHFVLVGSVKTTTYCLLNTKFSSKYLSIYYAQVKKDPYFPPILPTGTIIYPFKTDKTAANGNLRLCLKWKPQAKYCQNLPPR